MPGVKPSNDKLKEALLHSPSTSEKSHSRPRGVYDMSGSSTMSTSWLPYALREEELRRVDSLLDAAPGSIELLQARARLLTELGKIEEAKAAYLKAVTLDPTNFAVLNDFGKLLHEIGYRSAAATLIRQAIAHHAGNPTAYTNLGNVCYADRNLEAARRCYEQALALDPEQAEAHRGLSYVLRDIGDERGARTHRQAGFAGSSVFIRPYRGRTEPIRLLQIISAAGGNAAVDPFLDAATFLTTIVIAEYFDGNVSLPVHDLLVNAVADADLCVEALTAADAIARKSTAPVINPVQAVNTRAETAARLAAIPNFVAPKTVNLGKGLLASDRAGLTLDQYGFHFPILLRSPGFHSGMYLERVDSLTELEASLARLPSEMVTVTQFVDGRGADGKYRKYRVMMIDGEFYPLHLAIARDWKVHYFTAEMADNPTHRAEDEAFLENMTQVLGEKGTAALKDIQAALGLDYAGIDFGMNSHGQVVLYEANAAMIVLPPGPDARWDYRRPHVRRIVDAVRNMMIQRASQV